MPVKTVLFLVVFAAACGGAIFLPLIGVLGYVGHYSIGPESQWWSAPLRHWGIRFSFSLAVVTAIGAAVHWRRLAYGPKFLMRQEWLILAFLGLMWLLYGFAEETTGKYQVTDHPTVKVLKVVVFVLLMTHIVTRQKHLDYLLWAIVVGALVLGLQAYDTPRSAFESGRLETVGGPDFRETNGLAAYLAAMLPLIGVQFLRSKWPGKVLSLLAGAFTTNAIILTRSRGAILAVAAGCALAVVLSPRKYRVVISVGLIVAAIAGYTLTDPGFLARASTITGDTATMDASAVGRIEIWKASLKMLADHPLGVGVGNFYQFIGRYNSDLTGRDAHNTFIRCYGELGIPGLLLFLALIANAGWTLRRVVVRAQGLPPLVRQQVALIGYGLAVSLATLLAGGLIVTLLYMEALWWFLAMPVCLERAVANLKVELQPVSNEPNGRRRLRPRSLQRQRSPDP